MHNSYLFYVNVIIIIGGSDFNGRTKYIRIPAGATSVPISITIYNDNRIEGNEIFSVYIQEDYYLRIRHNVVLGVIRTATVTIIDDDCKYICM